MGPTAQSAVFADSPEQVVMAIQRLSGCPTFAVSIEGSYRRIPLPSPSPPLHLQLTGIVPNRFKKGSSEPVLFTAVFDLEALAKVEQKTTFSQDLEILLSSSKKLFVGRDIAYTFIEVALRYGISFPCFGKPVGASVDLTRYINPTQTARQRSSLKVITKKLTHMGLDTDKDSAMNQAEQQGRQILIDFFECRRNGVVKVRIGLNYGVTRVWSCTMCGCQTLSNSRNNCSDSCRKAQDDIGGIIKPMTSTLKPIYGPDVKKLEILAQK